MYIDHVAIWADDLEKMKDFYVRYFNCRAGDKYVNPAKKFASYFLIFSNGARLELMSREDVTGKKAAGTIGLAHVALNAGSRGEVDRLTAFLEKEGVTIAGKPRLTGDGYYESMMLDPEGNIVEIVSS